MTKKKLLIIGTIILLCSTILNTTIEFYIVDKIGELRSEVENKNRLIILTFQAEVRGALEYELADNLCLQNISFRISSVKKEAIPHLANFQSIINRKLATSIIDLKAAINYRRVTTKEESNELNDLAMQGSIGYLKLSSIYGRTRDSLTTVRKGIVNKRDAVAANIKYWDNIRSKILFLSVFFQVVALVCFAVKDLKDDK